jgi:hypothetical protein
MSAREYLRHGLLRPCLVGVLFFAVAWEIASKANLTFASLIGAVLAQTLVFLFLMWSFGLTSDERHWLKNYARQQVRWPALRACTEFEPQGTNADLS